MSDKEKMVVAYHEIGHALVAAKQSESAPVHKITIIPRTSGALGYTMQVEEGEHFLLTKEELENKIATFTGGRAAVDGGFARDHGSGEAVTAGIAAGAAVRAAQAFAYLSHALIYSYVKLFAGKGQHAAENQAQRAQQDTGIQNRHIHALLTPSR